MKVTDYAKTDVRYWPKRVYRPRNSQGKESPHYAVQMQVKGRHMSLGLRTGNREVAARKAAEIYTNFITLGIERAPAKHRPKRPEAERVASVGEYLEAARAVMDVRPISFANYASCLRLVAAAILIRRLRLGGREKSMNWSTRRR